MKVTYILTQGFLYNQGGSLCTGVHHHAGLLWSRLCLWLQMRLEISAY